MTVRSGFFNSINGDRKYDAGRFAEYFASFIGNGVFPNPSTGLQVVANDDMTVTVKPGKAWINGYILINDDDYILQLDPADGVLNRIDRVVARYDTTDREIRLQIKKGTPASSPVDPGLQRDADAYELGLADIYIGKGAISISQANITDLRFNNNYCGIVKGTVDQIDTTNLFAQYDDAFNTWFETVKDVLDDNTAGHLLNLINQNTVAIATKAEQMDFEQLQQEINEHLAETATLVDLTNTNNYVFNTGININLASVPTGQIFSFICANGSTGNITIKIDNNQPYELRNRKDNTQLGSGKIKNWTLFQAWWDAGLSCFFLLARASGNAVAGDILAGKTASTDEGEIVGTMPNNGSQTATLTITGSAKPTKTIPAGYTSGGTITAQLDSSLASEIAEGNTVGGIVGTAQLKLKPGLAVKNYPFYSDSYDNLIYINNEGLWSAKTYIGVCTCTLVNDSGVVVKSLTLGSNGQWLVFVGSDFLVTSDYTKLYFYNKNGVLLRSHNIGYYTANCSINLSTNRLYISDSNYYIRVYDYTTLANIANSEYGFTSVILLVAVATGAIILSVDGTGARSWRYYDNSSGFASWGPKIGLFHSLFSNVFA